MTRYDEEREDMHRVVKKGSKIAAVGLAGVLSLVAFMKSCTTVPAGHVSLVNSFGQVQSQELEPGLHFVRPWASTPTLDARTQEIKEEMAVPTKEGLIAKLDVSLLYHLDWSKADSVYKQVGMDYAKVIVEPMMRNVTRDVVAGYSSEDLYNANRQKIAVDIDTKLRKAYEERGVVLESVLMRGVSLPAEVTSAIEQKIKSKQQSEQMEYILTKESQEAERKRLEAKGIADAQHIIAASLNQEYLQWKYITTLEGLAGSPNTTFVITPYDQKLMPMLPLDKSHTAVPAPGKAK